MMLDTLALQDNGIPIYVQLREQIAAAIGRGELKPGDRLPTMRQVAVALSIDLNTVQRAYAELQREGILSTEQGRGSFVARPVAGRGDARALAEAVAAQARAAGVALPDLVAALDALPGRAP